jgi:UDP-hydrolysing UDP-N-acetyl-D-glucosamine 2-epimerase
MVAVKINVISTSISDQAYSFAIRDEAVKRGHIITADHPDVAVVNGDRSELLTEARALLEARVPIAHVGGGDTTKGAIDDLVRDAITALSDYHFATNYFAYERLLDIARNTDHVVYTGEPHIYGLPTWEGLSDDYWLTHYKDIPQAGDIALRWLPVTKDQVETAEGARVLSKEAYLGDATVWISRTETPDRGWDTIKQATRGMMRTVYLDNNHPDEWRDCMRRCRLVVGNSSSALIEAPSLRCATINVGTRQKGRCCGPSVFHYEFTGYADYLAIMRKARAATDFANPYYPPTGMPAESTILSHLELWV